MLKGERGDLAASLHNLGIAMRQVSGFVSDNREILGKNIAGLDQVTQILVKQRAALAETLRDAPLALNNLPLTYNPQAGTLDTRANLGEIGQPDHRPTRPPSCAASSTRPTRAARRASAVQQILGKNRAGALAGGAGAPRSRSTAPTRPSGGLVEGRR